MNKKENYKIYILRYDGNSETECFFSVTIPGPIPNADHSYHGKDFDYEYISGDISIYDRSVKGAKNVIWNGYCLATQKFFFEDLAEAFPAEPGYFYREREYWTDSAKVRNLKSVYEVKCRDIYFEKGTSLKKKLEIMREMLTQRIATDKLHKEISKII